MMKTRPIGISILALLHTIGGAALFGIQFLLLPKLGELQRPLEQVGIPPILLVLGVMILASLAIGSGIGMWCGTRWGWWLGAFYYVYGVLRNASAILTIASMADQLGASTRGPGYYYFKHTGRVIVHLLILLYFFRANVLDYFGLTRLGKWKAFSALAGIAFGIGIAASVLSALWS